MNIYHLKYFIDTVRLGSLSKSADLNNVSHSAVSQGIKSLEVYLNVELLKHSKRKFQMTPQGEAFFKEGHQLLTVIETTRNNVRRTDVEPSGDLMIWAPQSLVVDFMVEKIGLLRSRYPKINISIKTGAAQQVRQAISNKEAHLGFLVDDGHLASFNSIEINKGKFALISKTHDVNLKESPIIITSPDKIEVNHLRKHFKSKFKSEMKVSMEVVSWGIIKHLVLKKFGVGYVPKYCVRSEIENRKLHEITPPWPSFDYSIKAIWPKASLIHPNAKILLELMGNIKK